VLAGVNPGDTPTGTSLDPWDLNVRPQPQPYTFRCRDIIGMDAATGVPNGFADIGTCASWDQASTSLANEFSQAYPGTSAKCRCERTPTDIPVANFQFDCNALTLTPPPVGAISYQVEVSNDLLAGNSCDPTTGTQAERYRCGTVGYVRVVVEYDKTNGSMTSYTENTNGTFFNWQWPVTANNSTLSVINDTSGTVGKLIWTIKNRAPAPGPELGVMWPNWTTQPLLRYVYTPTVPGSYSFPTQVYWSNTLDFVTPFAGTPDADDLKVFNADCKVQTCFPCTCNGDSTNAVTLASFAATRENGRVRFAWSTATEVTNVGFNIYGRAGDEWRRLNADLIPAQGHGAEPQGYTVTLEVPAGITMFAIEDVDRGGKATRHPEVKAVNGDDGAPKSGLLATSPAVVPGAATGGGSGNS
jgi:hypothetical protein